jgi:hypothetical protein
MKRKFKLITAIASLTAAIALLMFGVYAATARTVNISGTVSFSATNVNAVVEVYQTTGDEYGDPILTLDYAINGDFVATTEFEGGVGGYDEYTATGLLNISLSDSVLVYKYKIKITNRMETSPITIAYANSYKDPDKVDWVTEGGTHTATTVPVGTVPEGNNVVELEFIYTVIPNKAPARGTFPVGGTLTLTRAQQQQQT